MRWGIGILLAIPAVTWAGSGHLVSSVTMEEAVKLASAAVKHCGQDGYRVSATVVDAGGQAKAVLRADGAGPHTLDSSRKKAYTALSLRTSTRVLAGLVAGKPEIAGLRDMNSEILILGGGLPIKMGDEVIGAIGVGGAPGDTLDENCAKAALESFDKKD